MEELRGAGAGNTGYNKLTRGAGGHTHTHTDENTHMSADVKGILQGWTRGSNKHCGIERILKQ